MTLYRHANVLNKNICNVDKNVVHWKNGAYKDALNFKVNKVVAKRAVRTTHCCFSTNTDSTILLTSMIEHSNVSNFISNHFLLIICYLV